MIAKSDSNVKLIGAGVAPYGIYVETRAVPLGRGEAPLGRGPQRAGIDLQDSYGAPGNESNQSDMNGWCRSK